MAAASNQATGSPFGSATFPFNPNQFVAQFQQQQQPAEPNPSYMGMSTLPGQPSESIRADDLSSTNAESRQDGAGDEKGDCETKSDGNANTAMV
jgi:hypothetical protein